jgi:BASS family bile acid:Na+ symporter
MEPGFIIEVFFPIVVILVMFGLGMSLTPDDFKRVLIYPKAVTIGLINQLVLLPLVAYLLVVIFPLNPELAVGVIIIATAPGGVLSNVITHLAEADTALSVTLTALSSLLAFIIIPLWLSLAIFWLMDISGPLNVPILQLAVQIAALTLMPIGSGLFVRLQWPGAANSLRISIRFGSILLVTMVTMLNGR